jgi:hypothetical protein
MASPKSPRYSIRQLQKSAFRGVIETAESMSTMISNDKFENLGEYESIIETVSALGDTKWAYKMLDIQEYFMQLSPLI